MSQDRTPVALSGSRLSLSGNILSGHEAIDWDCACLRVGSLFRSALLRLRFGRVALAATLRG
jgi:hypothetical protein